MSKKIRNWYYRNFPCGVLVRVLSSIQRMGSSGEDSIADTVSTDKLIK